MTFKFFSFHTIVASLLIGFILIPIIGSAQPPIPIQCGQIVMGSFSTPGQKNSYSFTGTAGDHVSIFVEEPGNMTFLPTIRLFSPGEEEIGYGWGDLHATLPASGVYRVDVTFGSAEAGNYLLVWQRWNNPCGATNIDCGQVLKASIGGTVDVPPWRFYSFEGLAGDMTIFGSGMPLIRAKDSQGNLLGSSYDRLDITLPTSGTYHFWIMSITDQGDYSVRWQRWNNPCNAPLLFCGQTISTSLGASGQHDYYTFNASAGDALNINLVRTSGNMIPYLQLLDSTGTQIGFGIGYVGSVNIDKMLSTGGTYIIEVSDDGDKKVGSYKLKVQKNNNSCPEVLLTAPNGGEMIESGSTCNISWTSASPGPISSQEIRLSKDGGLTFPTIIATGLPGNAQSFNWTIPTDMATPKGRIRVTVTDVSGSVYDDSDADFVIPQYVPKVSRTYVYDKVNQLIQIIYEDGSSIHYSYDAVGNRIALTGASQSEGVLSVTPSEGLSSSGNQGGPFNPSTKDYFLENRGGGPIDYTVNKSHPWITFSETGGSIAAGASTQITVSVNSNANALGVDSYTDTVSFTNTTNGVGNATRNISLTVNATSEAITAPASPSGPTSGDAGTIYAYSTTGGSSSSLGHNVQYLFDWRDGTDSGWLPVGQNSASKIWTSVGTFNIRVQARCVTDTSVVSPWSGMLTVNITTVDTTPPTPNSMTWATPPYQTGSHSISMVATTAMDPVTPITYNFNFTDSPTGGAGGNHSNWQVGTSYTNFGLEANHQYGYRVKAKDGANNENSYSTPNRYAYTAIENTTGITFGTVTSTSIQGQSTNTPSGLNRGDSGLLIENTTNSINSGWKQDNSFWTSNLLTPNTSYSFRAKVRNGDAIEMGSSPVASKYTLANAPGNASFSNISQTCIQANWTANGNPAGTQYFCENQTLATHSGWITGTFWDSCALSFGTLYSFRVKAKNAEGIETDWTSLGSQSTVAVFPSEGTYGTELVISGSGFGVKKGKVSIESPALTVSLTILDWKEDGVKCRLAKVVPSGTYDIVVQPVDPKGTPSIKYKEAFVVRPAEIHSIEQGSGTAYDEVTIKGKFFGTKKGKVYLEYQEGESSVRKTCKVVSWEMNSITNDSQIVFIVPKMSPGLFDVLVDPYSTLEEVEKENGFEIKAPEIVSVNPGSGSVGVQITISGKYFGSKKPKVYLGYVKDGKETKKSCSIFSLPTDPTSIEGKIVFIVPNLPAESYYDVIVTNSVGSARDSQKFNIE